MVADRHPRTDRVCAHFCGINFSWKSHAAVRAFAGIEGPLDGHEGAGGNVSNTVITARVIPRHDHCPTAGGEANRNACPIVARPSEDPWFRCHAVNSFPRAGSTSGSIETPRNFCRNHLVRIRGALVALRVAAAMARHEARIWGHAVLEMRLSAQRGGDLIRVCHGGGPVVR